MNRANLAENAALTAGITRIQAKAGIDALFQALQEALARHERIELRNFGVFSVKRRKRGVGRNPKTGVTTEIPPGWTVRFKAGKLLQGMNGRPDSGVVPPGEPKA